MFGDAAAKLMETPNPYEEEGPAVDLEQLSDLNRQQLLLLLVLFFRLPLLQGGENAKERRGRGQRVGLELEVADLFALEAHQIAELPTRAPDKELAEKETMLH